MLDHKRACGLLVVWAVLLSACDLTSHHDPLPPSPELQVSPNPADFGAVLSGESAVLDVVVSNVGTARVGGFTGGEPNNTLFALVESTCMDELLPTQSCAYSYSFSPNLDGQTSTTAMITTDTGTFDVVLNGAGVGSPLWVTPLVLDFDAVGIGEVGETQTITVANQGSTAITNLSDVSAGDPFSISSDCPDSLAPGASCELSFAFAPTEAGTFSDVSGGSTSAGSVIVELNGVGAGAELWVTPLSVDFGPVEVGGAGNPRIVMIRNVGHVELSDFSGGEPADTQFQLIHDCENGVAPGESCQYFFFFLPTREGAATTISSSNTNAGPFEIELAGTGVGGSTASPNLSFSPLVLDFGEIGVGQISTTQTVTIMNTGDATLTGFDGGAPADSQFGASQNCTGGVAPGATCQYSFSFSPTEAGTFATTSSSLTNAGPIVIELRGTGVGAALWVTPKRLSFGTLATDVQGAEQLVTIRNTGLATLSDFAGGLPSDNQFSGFQDCAGGVAPGNSCQYAFSFTPSANEPAFFETTSDTSTNAGSFVVELEGSTLGP